MNEYLDGMETVHAMNNEKPKASFPPRVNNEILVMPDGSYGCDPDCVRQKRVILPYISEQEVESLLKAKEAELEEQCRLNGMGAQRELELERDNYKWEYENVSKFASDFQDKLAAAQERVRELERENERLRSVSDMDQAIIDGMRRVLATSRMALNGNTLPLELALRAYDKCKLTPRARTAGGRGVMDRVFESHKDSGEMVYASAKAAKALIQAEVDGVEPRQAFLIYGRIIMLLFQWHFGATVGRANKHLDELEKADGK